MGRREEGSSQNTPKDTPMMRKRHNNIILVCLTGRGDNTLPEGLSLSVLATSLDQDVVGLGNGVIQNAGLGQCSGSEFHDASQDDFWV